MAAEAAEDNDLIRQLEADRKAVNEELGILEGADKYEKMLQEVEQERQLRQQEIETEIEDETRRAAALVALEQYIKDKKVLIRKQQKDEMEKRTPRRRSRLLLRVFVIVLLLAKGFVAGMKGLRLDAFGDTKGIAIAEATIATAEAAVNSYQWAAAWGGPPAGAAAAAIAIAAGVKQISTIKSAKPGSSGGASSSSAGNITPASSVVPNTTPLIDDLDNEPVNRDVVVNINNEPIAPQMLEPLLERILEARGGGWEY